MIHLVVKKIAITLLNQLKSKILISISLLVFAWINSFTQINTIYVHNNTREVLIIKSDTIIEQRIYYSNNVKSYSNSADFYAPNANPPFVHFINILKQKKDTLYLQSMDGKTMAILKKNELLWNQKTYEKISEEILIQRFRMDEELKQAIENNEIDKVDKLIKNGACVNAIAKKIYINNKRLFGVYFYDVPYIAIAVNKAQIELVKLLVNSGANINVKDDKGNTLLMYSIMSGSLQMVELIYNLSANLNQPNNAEKTPLQIAEFYDYPEIINFLKNK